MDSERNESSLLNAPRSMDVSQAYNPRMFRPFTLFMFLLFGLALSIVFIAWAAIQPRYAVHSEDLADHPFSKFELRCWHRYAPVKWQTVMPQVKVNHQLGRRHLWIAAGRQTWGLPEGVTTSQFTPDYRPNLFEIHVKQFGWPFRCMYSESWNEFVDGNLGLSGENSVRIGGHVFPTSIMPLGLIANVFAIGLGAWLVVGLAICVMRDLRLRAGKCPHCAYRLGEHLNEGCPECGWKREPGATERGAPPD